MKKTNLLILILSTLTLVICGMEEFSLCAEAPVVGSISTESVRCTPKVTDYDYVENVNIINLGLDCVPEFIKVDELITHHKVRLVQCAGCHINNNGSRAR